MGGGCLLCVCGPDRQCVPGWSVAQLQGLWRAALQGNTGCWLSTGVCVCALLVLPHISCRWRSASCWRVNWRAEQGLLPRPAATATAAAAAAAAATATATAAATAATMLRSQQPCMSAATRRCVTSSAVRRLAAACAVRWWAPRGRPVHAPSAGACHRCCPHCITTPLPPRLQQQQQEQRETQQVVVVIGLRWLRLRRMQHVARRRVVVLLVRGGRCRTATTRCLGVLPCQGRAAGWRALPCAAARGAGRRCMPRGPRGRPCLGL